MTVETPAAPGPTAAGVLAAGRQALALGDGASALAAMTAVVEMCPRDPEAHYWLASALLAVGEPVAAEQALNDARTFHAVGLLRELEVDMGRFRADPGYAAAVGRQFYGAKLVGLAALAFGQAMEIDGFTAELLLQYGLSLQHQGRAEDSIAALRALADTYPSANLHQYLLYALFYGEDGCRRYAEEAGRWAAAWAPASAPRPAVRAPGRRLRVGYVAPSFTRSQVRQFVLPVLQAHDPAAVRLFLYPAQAEAEQGLPAHAKVRSIGHLPDVEAADLIGADGLDILIDLWGHTGGSRLTLFTHRPAPVQAGFVNFNQTTGLDCIDYVLHADSMETPDADGLFTETVWRLGPITVPFLPQADRPPVSPAPARANGYVTYGSFNHPAKLSAQTVRGWAAILQAQPTARLVLKYGYFADPVLQRATQSRFAAFGIEPARIEFRGHTTGAAYLAEFADIDLALDPSPCTGGTTTCEALSNGVPVLTLKGDDFFSRIGLQCLYGVGAPELIAESWDDYVAIAGRVTTDLDSLDALRLNVREAFETGPYGDFDGFTRSLEAQYRQMILQVRDRTRGQDRAQAA